MSQAEMDLAAALNRLKVRRGSSYVALAKRVGVSRSALHRYTSGDAVPARFEVVSALARECEATPAELAELRRLWQAAITAPAAAEPTPPAEEPSTPDGRPLSGDTKPVRRRLVVGVGVAVAVVAAALLIGPTWTSAAPDEPVRPTGPATSGDRTVQRADLDGDGRDDTITIRDGGEVVATRGGDTGSRPVPVAFGFVRPDRVQFADLDGDGRAELLDVRDGMVVAYRNLGWRGAETFDGDEYVFAATGLPEPTRIRFADVDGDGRADLLDMRPEGAVVYRNRGWDARPVFATAGPPDIVSPAPG